jgi:hypothetical protein
LHFLHKVGAHLVQLFHAHLGGDGAQGIDELTFHQLFEFERLEGFLAQRLRRVGDAFGGRLDAHVELGLHIDAHTIFRNERLFARTQHFEAQRVHVDPDDIVQTGSTRAPPFMMTF